MSPRPRPPRGALSLQWKLPLLMTGVLAIGLAVAVALAYWTLAERDETVVRERLAATVREVALTAEVSMRQRASEVQAVASHPDVVRALAPGGRPDSATSAALRPIASMQRPMPVEIWDASGRVALAIGPPVEAFERPAPPGPDGLRLTPMYAVRDLVRFWIVAPVRRDGRTLGYVASARSVGGPPDAMRMLRRLTGEELVVYTRNADGRFWAMTPSVPVQPPESRDSTPRGLRIRRGGVEHVAYERAIAGTPWIVVAELPRAVPLARTRQVVSRFAGASALLLLAGALLSWLLGRRLTRPISALTAAAEDVARGDYRSGPVDAGGDEVGRLAASFHSMADEVTTTRRELERRVVEAESARRDAERANRAKSDFLAVMSHELRTPLNAIGGYVQLLEMELRGPVTAEQRVDLERIGRSQRLLLSLINDVLNFAKLEAAKVEFHIDDVPLDALVAPLCEVVAPQMQAKRITFVVEPIAGLVARADAEKAGQVLLNLLSNAVKYTPAGGRVEVAATATGDRVRVTVRDTGVGIPESQLARIFEPFVQLNRSLTTTADGTGLGLAISRELARAMRGDLEVRSEPGVGSEFSMVLPRAHALPRARPDAPLAGSRSR